MLGQPGRDAPRCGPGRGRRRRGTRRARPRRPVRPTAAPSEATSRPAGAPKRISSRWPAEVSSAGVPLASTRPWSMMTTRSASFSASSRSWVVSSTATPWAAQVGDHPPDELAPARVDAGGRLVEEGDLGPADQGERQRQPLLLAAGEVAPRRPATIAEADPLEQLVGVVRVVVVGGEQPQHLGRPDAGVDAAVLQHDADAAGELGVVGAADRARAPGPCRTLGRR